MDSLFHNSRERLFKRQTKIIQYLYSYLHFVLLYLHGGRNYSRAVGYSRELPPSKRLGSYEREITNMGTGNNFETNHTTA